MKAIVNGEANTVEWRCESQKELDTLNSLFGMVKKCASGSYEYHIAVKELQRHLTLAYIGSNCSKPIKPARKR